MGSPALIDPAKIDALSFVLGSKQVDYYQLSTQEKVQLFKQLIETLGESFKYFPGFKPAETLTKRKRHNIWSDIAGPRVIEGPSGFNAKTLCIELFPIWDKEDSRRKRSIERLLLTRGRRIVLWRAEYRLVDRNKRPQVWRTHSSSFGWLTDRRLGSLLQSGDIAKHLIWGLERIANDAIEERDILLGRIRQNLGDFKKIVGRVDLDTRD